jgi:hypothetical protein
MRGATRVPIFFLRAHPGTCSPVTKIAVEVECAAPDVLRLTYRVGGDLARMAIPRVQTANRADGLWRHSCFEIFLAAGQGYYEFNFSPSSQWAAYRFDSHRTGMRDAATDAPAIVWDRDGEAAKLTTTIRLPADANGPLGLSAIIEDLNGNRSFWALAHPPGEPDFHDPACFAAQLPPAE